MLEDILIVKREQYMWHAIFVCAQTHVEHQHRNTGILHIFRSERTARMLSHECNSISMQEIHI